MKTKYLCALALVMAACSGKEVSSPSSGEDTLALKKAAAEAASQETANGPTPSHEDVCAAHAWYGDGVCDTFCTQNDSDCVLGGDSTVCAEFIEQADGTCSRPENDPCRFQDADCAGQTPPSSGDGGTVCATISEVSDGVCKRSDTDPCRFQDPDCQQGGGSDGNPGTGGSGAGGSNGGGIACPAIAMVPNGKCELPASDPCRSIDPDCVVACATFVEQSDGECKRDPYDPCIFQDPDCKVK